MFRSEIRFLLIVPLDFTDFYRRKAEVDDMTMGDDGLMMLD